MRKGHAVGRLGAKERRQALPALAALEHVEQQQLRARHRAQHLERMRNEASLVEPLVRRGLAVREGARAADRVQQRRL